MASEPIKKWAPLLSDSNGGQCLGLVSRAYHPVLVFESTIDRDAYGAEVARLRDEVGRLTREWGKARIALLNLTTVAEWLLMKGPRRANGSEREPGCSFVRMSIADAQKVLDEPTGGPSPEAPADWCYDCESEPCVCGRHVTRAERRGPISRETPAAWDCADCQDIAATNEAGGRCGRHSEPEDDTVPELPSGAIDTTDQTCAKQEKSNSSMRTLAQANRGRGDDEEYVHIYAEDDAGPWVTMDCAKPDLAKWALARAGLFPKGSK